MIFREICIFRESRNLWNCWKIIIHKTTAVYTFHHYFRLLYAIILPWIFLIGMRVLSRNIHNKWRSSVLISHAARCAASGFPAYPGLGGKRGLARIGLRYNTHGSLPRRSVSENEEAAPSQVSCFGLTSWNHVAPARLNSSRYTSSLDRMHVFRYS